MTRIDSVWMIETKDGIIYGGPDYPVAFPTEERAKWAIVHLVNTVHRVVKFQRVEGYHEIQQ